MIHSAEEFVRLRTSADSVEYGRAASDSAPIEVWFNVLVDYPDMKPWVAHNKTVPLEVLSLLARDNDPGVRRAVAAKRKLSAELFLFLARDADSSVRARIAQNSRVPTAVLEVLVGDEEEFVRVTATRQLDARPDA